MLLLQKDDQVAFYQIYERYGRRLFGFVLRYIKQEADAEEIVQEVFLKIWEARYRIDLFSSFESFLFTIAYNATIGLLRKRVTERKYIDYLKTMQNPDASNSGEEEVHFHERNEKIHFLLNQLTPRQREIFLLSREEGLTHEEIAVKLQISVNTVKKHMVNTLAFLRSHIDTDMAVGLFYVSLFL